MSRRAASGVFTALGGTPVQNGTLQMIQFPGVFILMRQADATGGTVGSVVNHFGFNVKDLKASVREMADVLARWSRRPAPTRHG